MQVHHAMWQHTEVAVKLFAIPVAPVTASAAADPAAFSASVVAKMQQEAALIAGLRHPNVIALFGVCLSPPCIVMEHCGRGALYDVLGAARASPAAAAPLTWRWRLHVALDAALGMLHLHSRSPPVVHRDLKSPNLLLDAASRCKVADFNLSRILEEVGQRSGAASTVAVPTNPRWLAPEVLGGQRPSPPSDVYSFGVVLWELLTWELPYSGVVNPFAVRGAAQSCAAHACFLGDGVGIEMHACLILRIAHRLLLETADPGRHPARQAPGAAAAGPAARPRRRRVCGLRRLRVADGAVLGAGARGAAHVWAGGGGAAGADPSPARRRRCSRTQWRRRRRGPRRRRRRPASLAPCVWSGSPTRCWCTGRPSCEYLFKVERVLLWCFIAGADGAVFVARVPCRVHQCCCAECAALLQQRGQGCPVCRRPIDEVMLHFR